MPSITYYSSPLGELLLSCDDIGLTGIWYDRQNFVLESMERDTPVLQQTKHWLDVYFSGEEPDFAPPIHLQGTPFQLAVWKHLSRIPYGETITYGEIAGKIAEERGIARMSAQAVGGAVGHNPVSIIVPCHRVIGANGSLTGYAGGIMRKKYLLELEQGI